MAGKGDKNRTNPHSPEWFESYDRIFGQDGLKAIVPHLEDTKEWIKIHPKGSCGGYCSECEGGCTE